MEKLGKAHAAERHGLKEKLERLQRANKQRRSEIEEMQTKLSSMHQRASAYDQVGRLWTGRRPAAEACGNMHLLVVRVLCSKLVAYQWQCMGVHRG